MPQIRHTVYRSVVAISSPIVQITADMPLTHVRYQYWSDTTYWHSREWLRYESHSTGRRLTTNKCDDKPHSHYSTMKLSIIISILDRLFLAVAHLHEIHYTAVCVEYYLVNAY